MLRLGGLWWCRGVGRGTLPRRSPESAGAASKRAMEGHVDCIRTFVRSMASVRVVPGLSEIRRIHSSRHLASTPITSVRRKPPYCPLRRRSASRAAKETKAARTESHGAPSTLVANRGKPWNTRALMPESRGKSAVWAERKPREEKHSGRRTLGAGQTGTSGEEEIDLRRSKALWSRDSARLRPLTVRVGLICPGPCGPVWYCGHGTALYDLMSLSDAPVIWREAWRSV